jgi:biopolymer transport protein ExbD
MPKFKPHRAGVRVDMTPLVDVAFLLLTFFMLTTQFKPDEYVDVVLPMSHADIKLPEGNVLTICISEKAATDPTPQHNILFGADSTHIWMGLDSQLLRQRIFAEYKDLYGDSYYLKPTIYPVRKSQLANYILQARIANPKLVTVIKGDREAVYGYAEDVMEILQKTQVTRFSLVTDLAAPTQPQ